ncbi:F-box domain-containing protein [Mycena venus]|uniref:F-box domain-containing protein n=1 Tax=Mycena venus TaxID=2733690 RepID=A0A8H7CAK9_9AGAR|nr:F-box domain-containing protein [Mycena venus]
MDETEPLLRLPDEILVEIFQHLDPYDPGIFAISTLNKRLHYIALPIYLSGYGIPDASAPVCQEIVLMPSRLHLLGTLQTALFIRSVKHISCSFFLNTLPHHIRRLTTFLSVLESVDEVTLVFLVGLNLDTTVPILELVTSAITKLVDVIMERQVRVLTIQDNLFLGRSSFQEREMRSRTTVKRLMSDVGRRIGRAFVRRAEAPAPAGSRKFQPSLQKFELHSALLLLPPCHSWTMAALRTFGNLTSLSIARIETPERSCAEILSSIHLPSLEYFSMNLRCKIPAAALDHFFLRHPLISILSLGADLYPLAGNHVSSKGCLPKLANLSASPSYVRFIMADKRAPVVCNVRLLINVSGGLFFRDINPPRVWYYEDSLIRDTGTRMPSPDSLRNASALELVSTGFSVEFVAFAIHCLPSFPALQSLSLAGCSFYDFDARPFFNHVKQACPEIQSVTLDGQTYDVKPDDPYA